MAPSLGASNTLGTGMSQRDGLAFVSRREDALYDHALKIVLRGQF